MELLSDAVILTTGGFGRNKELLSKYTPAIKELPSTNGPWAQGEGVLIAEEIGASLVHMDQVHTRLALLESRPCLEDTHAVEERASIGSSASDGVR